jgi:hypothetical protein
VVVGVVSSGRLVSRTHWTIVLPVLWGLQLMALTGLLWIRRSLICVFRDRGAS